MTNWDNILERGMATREIVREFALGGLTKNQAMKMLAYSNVSGEFRKLVRRVGAEKARELARRALRYRDYLDDSYGYSNY